MTVVQIQRQMRSLSSPALAASAARYFKTGPGEYSERDIFLGLRAAQMHALARQHRSLPLADIRFLVQSPIHEDRLLALLIVRANFAKADEPTRAALWEFYQAHTPYINNWDLVDASAAYVVGQYLETRSRKPLYRLARSRSLWERRIAIVATHHFIRQDDFTDTLQIAEILLEDVEDLIHKATGWMLREVGKRRAEPLETFLKRHHAVMPRTMLRYAIERFPRQKRLAYLHGRPPK